MKKIIVTIALVLIGLTSCKKEVITPNCPVTPPVELGTVISTNFITDFGVAADTYTVLKFRSSGGADQLFVNECGEVAVNTEFNSAEETRVEVYKNGDGNSNYIWMGNIKVNPADSTFIVTQIGGNSNVFVLPAYACGNTTKIAIIE